MEIQADPNRDLLQRIEDEQRAREELWAMVGAVWSRRWFIASVTGVAAIASIVIALLLPKWYLSTARVLLPEGGSSGILGAMVSESAPASIASLLGMGGGDYIRYRAILNSRSMKETLVEQFDLVTVYDVVESDAPMDDAIEHLDENVDFPIDEEYQFLAVRVLDRDPSRAADMANFFVDELNRRNSALLAQNAAGYRAFLGGTLAEAEAGLDSARTALQTFQEANGIVDLDIQAEAFLEGIAALRTEAIKAEIDYEVLRRQFGDDNARTRTAQAAAQAANAKVSGAFAGQERVLPVAQDSLPDVARRYAEFLQDVLIQQEIVRFVRPLYEQARFDEQREKIAVQVLDRAQPAIRKEKPARKLIVILSTLSAFVLALLWVMASRWYARHGADVRRQIDALR